MLDAGLVRLIGPAHRWSAAALVVPLVAVQVTILVVLLQNAGEDRLHKADLALVAPPVVSDALVRGVNRLEGRPFDGRAVNDSESALAQVRRGAVVAALLVDLRGSTDRLVVDGARPERVRSAVASQVREVEQSHGRTVTVETSGPLVPSGRLRGLALSGSVGGFLLGLIAALRASKARSHPRLVRRGWLPTATATLGIALLGAWTVTGASTTRVSVAAALGGSLLTLMLLTRALHALAGWGGLAVGAVAHVLLAVPLVLDLDTVLLARPWSLVLEVAPVWATLELLAAVASYGGSGWLRPALVLLIWLGATTAGLLAARRHERRGEGPGATATDARWRARTAALLVPTVAGALAAWAFLPEPDLMAIPSPALASETECIATGSVTSVVDLNRISSQVRGDPSFQGGDVGAGVLLQDGRGLMVFGDTLRGPDFQGQQFVRNSMLVFGPDCVQTVLPINRGALIPDRVGPSDPAVGYWPMSIGRVERPGYDLVAIGVQRVRTTGTGVFDFEILGPAVAVFVVVRGQSPQLLEVRDFGTDSNDPRDPVWGASAGVDGKWVYLYGTANPREDYVFGYSLRVARVRTDDLLDIGSWRFWDGVRWRADPDRAVELIGAAGGVSETLSVFEQDGTWYALSKRDDFLGSEIVVWRAPRPWGPFDSGTTVARLPSDATTGQLRYMPLAHPDLLPEPGTVVVSYSRNRTDFGEVIANPFEYRPRFLRVTLPGRAD